MRRCVHVHPFKVNDTLISSSVMCVCMWEVLKFVEGYEVEEEEEENTGKPLHVSEINLCWTKFILWG